MNDAMDIFDRLAAEQTGQTGQTGQVGQDKSAGPDIFDRLAAEAAEAAEKTVEKVEPPTAQSLAKRVGKQLWNKTIANTINTIGDQMDIIGGKLEQIVPSVLIPGGKDYRTPPRQPKDIPTFDVAPSTHWKETGVDWGTGLTAFIAQLAVTRRLLPPGTPEAVVWETQNLANGGRPGQGAAMAATFHGIAKIPAKTLLGKIGKFALESGTLGAITAAEGGTPEEIAFSASIPGGFRAAGAIGKALKPGPRVRPHIPGPDVVRQGQPGVPQEPPAVITAEGEFPQFMQDQVRPASAREHAVAENKARLAGQFGAELDAKDVAYQDLLDAINTGDTKRIALARQEYAETGPPRQEQVRQASNAGDPEAQARLTEGFFQTDPVDTVTPLTPQERSIAKRMGYGKVLTSRGGTMTPGQVRAIIRGDQGASEKAPKPELKPEAKPGVKPEVEPESELVSEKIRIPAPGKDKSKNKMNRDLDIIQKIGEDIAAKRVNKEGQVVVYPLEPVRHGLGAIEPLLGAPLKGPVRRLAKRISDVPGKFFTDFKEFAKKNNVPTTLEEFMSDPVYGNMTAERQQKIADALYDGNFSQLSPGDLVIASKIAKYDAEVGRPTFARRRWETWIKTGEAPDPLKGDPELAKKVLTEGKKAEENGVLDAWLVGQPWVAKEHYWMQDPTDIFTGGVAEILYGKGALGKSKTALRSRKPGGKAKKTTNLWLDRINHTIADKKALIALDEVPEIMKTINNANFEPRSKERVIKVVKNAVGKPDKVGDMERYLAQTKQVFWLLKFSDPQFSVRFSAQNATQMNFMFTHMRTDALFHSVVDLGKQVIFNRRDPGRIEQAERRFGTGSREYAEIKTTLEDAESDFVLNHPELTKATAPLRKAYLAIGRLSSMSDPMFRELSWHMYFTSAKNDMVRFRDGKLDWDVVTGRNKLKIMPTNDYEAMDTHLRHGKIDMAAAVVANSKAADTHGLYETTERSFLEQTAGGRSIPGPLVYATSVYEMLLQQGIRPIHYGLKYKDYKLAYEGAHALLNTAVSVYVGTKVLEKVIGKAYPLWASLLVSKGPGLDILFGVVDSLEHLFYQTEEQNVPTEELAKKVAGVMATDLERMIPTMNVLTSAYESAKDIQGVKLSKLILAQLNKDYAAKYGRQWKKADRTTVEAMLHIITGGFEEGQLIKDRREIAKRMRPIP